MLSDLQLNLERIANGVNAEWGVYVKFLANGEEIAVNADRPMDTMSVIKIPLLVELFRQVDAGRISLDRRITLQTAHKRFGTGVLRTLGLMTKSTHQRSATDRGSTPDADPLRR